MDYTAIAAAIGCAIFWVKGMEAEGSQPFLWGAVSVLISVAIVFGLGKGWIAVLLGQAALFAGITVYRVVSDKDPG